MTDDIDFKKTTTSVPNGTIATTHIKLDYFNPPDAHRTYKMELRSPQDVYDWFLELPLENQRSMSDAFNSVVAGRKSSIYEPNTSVMSVSELELVSSEQYMFNDWVEPEKCPPPVPCAESLCIKPVPLHRTYRPPIARFARENDVDNILEPFPSYIMGVGTGVIDLTKEKEIVYDTGVINPTKEEEFVIEKPVLLRQCTMHSVTDRVHSLDKEPG